jgi:hypothetical protein
VPLLDELRELGSKIGALQGLDISSKVGRGASRGAQGGASNSGSWYPRGCAGMEEEKGEGGVEGGQ